MQKHHGKKLYRSYKYHLHHFSLNIFRQKSIDASTLINKFRFLLKKMWSKNVIDCHFSVKHNIHMFSSGVP